MAIRNLAAAAALAALSGCPYDETAADITAGDGGLWLGSPDDGGTFLETNPDGGFYGPETLPEAPTMDSLCKLYVGNAKGENDDTKRFIGTWIRDAIAIIGQPPRNGAVLGQDDALLAYQWRSTGGKLAGISMRFDYLPITMPDAAGVWYQLPDSYFLSAIQLRDGTYYDCWRWQLGIANRSQCGASCVFSDDKWRACMAMNCLDPSSPLYDDYGRLFVKIPGVQPSR